MLQYTTNSAAKIGVKFIKLNCNLTEQLNMNFYDLPYLNFRFLKFKECENRLIFPRIAVPLKLLHLLKLRVSVIQNWKFYDIVTIEVSLG